MYRLPRANPSSLWPFLNISLSIIPCSCSPPLPPWPDWRCLAHSCTTATRHTPQTCCTTATLLYTSLVLQLYCLLLNCLLSTAYCYTAYSSTVYCLLPSFLLSTVSYLQFCCLLLCWLRMTYAYCSTIYYQLPTVMLPNFDFLQFYCLLFYCLLSTAYCCTVIFLLHTV